MEREAGGFADGAVVSEAANSLQRAGAGQGAGRSIDRQLKS